MSESYEALLSRLRAEYKLELPERFDLLERLTEAYGSGDEAARTELARRAHMLRGSAGSYGFADISTAAAAIEQRVTDAAPLLKAELAPLLKVLSVAVKRAYVVE